jgi:WD40 repeat protein
MHSPCRRALVVTSFLSTFATFAFAADGPEPTLRVSVDPSGGEGNGNCNIGRVSISADGRFIAFDSIANNLVPGDTNGSLDVFVYDRVAQKTERVSVDSAGVEGNGDSFFPMISANGLVVTFHSRATNLVANDTNGNEEVFVHDRVSGVTERMNVDSSGNEGNGGSFKSSISADGRFVSFYSYARNLVPGDTNGMPDIFVRDRQGGTTERVSVDSSGAQADNASFKSSISADGRFVAFDSYASNLVAGDTNGWTDVFVRDRQNGTTERVSTRSTGKQANGGSNRPAISADGRFVAFSSYASNLVTGDTNGKWDVFVKDRQTGATERVSVDSGGYESDGDSVRPTISADGRFVAFDSTATNLVQGDTNGWDDIFVHDRLTGTTVRVSVDSAGHEADAPSAKSAISADGRFVVIGSGATNLVAGDTNGFSDVFVHGPYLTLEGDPLDPAAGATLSLTTWGGDPNDLALLVLVGFDTTPMFVPAILGTFDATGVFAVGGTVPSGLSGSVAGLQTFGIIPTGKLGISNAVSITFQ